jgi:hypothetical protein
MTAKPRPCVVLVHLLVVDPAVDAVSAFEDEGDALKAGHERSALEYLSRQREQVTPLDRKHQRVVDNDVLNRPDLEKLLLSLSC